MLRRDDPDEYVRRARHSAAAHCDAMVGFMDAGAEVFDYGNSLRAEAKLGGFERAFDYPGFVPAYIRPLFCEGKGPFRWVALSGDPADIAATDRAVLEELPGDESLARWIHMAGERIAFQGLPARICWLGYGERRRVGLRFNEMVRSGELKAPIVIGRDHLDSGSVASPYRETESMLDGSDAIADWPLLNALVNTASGASWVSIHHGGGVGIGRSIHAGHGLRRRRHRARRARSSSACSPPTRGRASCATSTPATSEPRRSRSSAASASRCASNAVDARGLWCELAWLGGQTARGRACWSRSTAAGSRPSRPARRGRPGRDPPGRADAARASRTPTRTRSSARCAAAPRPAAGPSGPGASRCTAWPSGSTRTRYLALARATYAEMAQAGITAVGEFHYVHHGPGGVPYDDPNALGRALIAAAARGRHAADADRRLLPARRHRRAPGRRAAALLRRRRGGLGASASTSSPRTSRVRIGAAIHSVRAVDPESAAAVAAWARERGRAPARARVRAAGRERGLPRRLRQRPPRRCSPTPAR